MDKEYPEKITYVRPTILDLGAIEIVYGICHAKGSTPNPDSPDCTNGDFAGAGACSSGDTPNT